MAGDIFRALESLDQFRTVSKDLTRGTPIIATLGYAIVMLLLIAELLAYARVTYSTSVQVDDLIDDNMDIQFDISLYDLPCKFLQVGAWDKFGKERILSNDTFTYHPLDHTGQVQGKSYTNEEVATLEKEVIPTKEEVKELDADWASSSDHFKHNDFHAAVTLHDFTLVNFYAEWCSHCRQFHPTWKQATDATSEKRKFSDGDGRQATVKFLKINCVDFKDACQGAKIAAFPTVRLYKQDGTFEVFQEKRTLDNIIGFLTTSVRNSRFISARHHHIFSEGCRVAGMLAVPRVPGHFYLMAQPTGSVNVNPALTNISHVVNHLSFGGQDADLSTRDRITLYKQDKVPSEIVDHLAPLDGKRFFVERFHEAPEHTLKVVSTRIGNDKTLYQVTHTDRVRKIGGDDVPKARFAYDFSPLTVVVTVKSRPWYQFLTSLFAILGGAYTIVSICGGAVHSVAASVKGSSGKHE